MKLNHFELGSLSPFRKEAVTVITAKMCETSKYLGSQTNFQEQWATGSLLTLILEKGYLIKLLAKVFKNQ